MKEDKGLSCILVLLTGLPGAGKSSFLAAVEQQSLLANARSVAVKALRLDDFLRQRTEAFQPAAWQQASRELFAACEEAVDDHLDGKGASDVLLAFVEDNMHYHSMREKYWRLSKRLNRESARRGNGGLALMEVRFAVPLDVCVERNERRRGTPAYIPTHVILAMHELFEPCLRDEPVGPQSVHGRSDDNPPTPAPLWVIEQRTTKPWLLVTPQPSPPSSAPFIKATPEELASGFALLVLSERANELLCEQMRNVVAKGGLSGDEEQRRADASASYSSAAHRLDLAMRAMVRFSLQSLPPETASRLHRPIQALKKATLSDFKAVKAKQREGTGDEEDVVEQVLDAATAAFHAKLMDLTH